jgi:hypothetical protein
VSYLLKLTFVWIGLVACSTNDASMDHGSVDSRVAHYEATIAPTERELWLFVLDDAATPAARTLREQVAAAVRLPDGGPLAASESVCAGDAADPAHPDPIDLSVIVVRPSQRVESWTTPATLPGLAWRGDRDDPAAYSGWLDAIRVELVRESSTDAVANYSPVEAIHSALSRLSGERSSATPAESGVLETFENARPTYVRVFAAATRDDASPLAVSSYPIAGYQRLDAKPGFGFELRTLLLPASPSDPTVTPGEPNAATFPRWHEFASTLDTGSFHFPSNTPDGLFASHWLSGKQVAPCWSAEPVRETDGSAQCRVHVVTDDVQTCNASRGWIDPLVLDATNGKRSPKYETNPDGTKRRICEILQLTGDPLASCLTQLDSAPTSAGWCYPEPSDACRQGCPSGRVPIAFRFAGDSSRADATTLRLRYDCSLDPKR